MAYGARLESGLGASPQGFESPILRHADQRKRRSGPDGLGSAFRSVVSVLVSVDVDALSCGTVP